MLICAHLLVMLHPLLLFANRLIPIYFFVNKQTLVRPSFGGQTESENGLKGQQREIFLSEVISPKVPN
jgi:hypothetical protein